MDPKEEARRELLGLAKMMAAMTSRRPDSLAHHFVEAVVVYLEVDGVISRNKVQQKLDEEAKRYGIEDWESLSVVEFCEKKLVASEKLSS